jgi:hypothetical protein
MGFPQGGNASEAEPAIGAIHWIDDCWRLALSPLKEGHARLSPIKASTIRRFSSAVLRTRFAGATDGSTKTESFTSPSLHQWLSTVYTAITGRLLWYPASTCIAGQLSEAIACAASSAAEHVNFTSSCRRVLSRQ